MFTDRLLSAKKEGCSRESLKGSGLQSGKPRVYAVEGKCSEEKPRALAQGSWFKGVTLRSRESVLRRMHISSSKHGTCQGRGRSGGSKGTSVDEQKGDISWIRFVWDQREMWPVYKDPVPCLKK